MKNKTKRDRRMDRGLKRVLRVIGKKTARQHVACLVAESEEQHERLIMRIIALVPCVVILASCDGGSTNRVRSSDCRVETLGETRAADDRFSSHHRLYGDKSETFSPRVRYTFCMQTHLASNCTRAIATPERRRPVANDQTWLVVSTWACPAGVESPDAPPPRKAANTDGIQGGGVSAAQPSQEIAASALNLYPLLW